MPGGECQDVLINSVELDGNRRMMKVAWKDSETDYYPYIWLRDNCQCAVCFHPVSKARTIAFERLDINITPLAAMVNDDVVSITWEDQHQGVFRASWLRERRFRTTEQRLKQRLLTRAPKTWSADPPNQIPTMKFNDILTDEEALYRWLTALEETGIVIIKDAPTETGQLHKIAKIFRYFRQTHYGETSFVKTKVDPNNLAYTYGRLTLHTDQAYLEIVPGMQLLHCIRQTESDGGENELVDGFHVAQQLRKTDPETFELLSKTELDYYDLGTEDDKEFFMLAKHAPIELNARGELRQINFSTHGRTSHMNIALEQVEPLYRALCKFCDLLYSPDNMVKYKMKNGDILSFDNRRILHGRGSFTPTKSGERLLEAGYIDWDELHSKRRVLAAKLGVTEAEY